MRFLIILVGFAFVVYVGLVKVIWELSQLSFHESPVIREAPGELAAAEYAKEVESYESSLSYLIQFKFSGRLTLRCSNALLTPAPAA